MIFLRKGDFGTLCRLPPPQGPSGALQGLWWAPDVRLFGKKVMFHWISYFCKILGSVLMRCASGVHEGRIKGSSGAHLGFIRDSSGAHPGSIRGSSEAHGLPWLGMAFTTSEIISRVEKCPCDVTSRAGNKKCAPCRFPCFLHVQNVTGAAGKLYIMYWGGGPGASLGEKAYFFDFHKKFNIFHRLKYAQRLKYAKKNLCFCKIRFSQYWWCRFYC